MRHVEDHPQPFDLLEQLAAFRVEPAAGVEPAKAVVAGAIQIVEVRRRLGSVTSALEQQAIEAFAVSVEALIEREIGDYLVAVQPKQQERNAESTDVTATRASG